MKNNDKKVKKWPPSHTQDVYEARLRVKLLQVYCNLFF
jgi:hypothetical protein